MLCQKPRFFKDGQCLLKARLIIVDHGERMAHQGRGPEIVCPGLFCSRGGKNVARLRGPILMPVKENFTGELSKITGQATDPLVQGGRVRLLQKLYERFELPYHPVKHRRLRGGRQVKLPVMRAQGFKVPYRRNIELGGVHQHAG